MTDQKNAPTWYDRYFGDKAFEITQEESWKREQLAARMLLLLGALIGGGIAGLLTAWWSK